MLVKLISRNRWLVRMLDTEECGCKVIYMRVIITIELTQMNQQTIPIIVGFYLGETTPLNSKHMKNNKKKLYCEFEDSEGVRIRIFDSDN